MERVLSRVSSATLVQVKKVTNKGEVKEVGTVDVLPLVNMQDGAAKQFKHQVVHGIPYFRLQGGADKAVIMDPKVDDIGVMVLADRDISKVKKTKKQAPPGSWRRFDMADGLFFPCFLGGKPKTYVQFTDDNKINLSPDEGATVLCIEKDKVTITSKTIQFKADHVYLEDGATDGVEGSDKLSTRVFVKAPATAPPDTGT